MKKYLFGTLCMSALLASCTNDELALTPQDNGEGEKIEVKLAASYPDYVDEANTRMALVGKEWAWINGDMLGACKVAAVGGSEIPVNTVTSNYPFMLTEELTEPTKNVSFKTNTAVFAGKYVFYHQYNGDLIGNKSDAAKDLFNVEFPTVQTVDPANPVEHVAKENIWVSPVIELGGIKYNKENETAVKFVGLNAVLKLNIKNNSKEGDLIINKVDVDGNEFSVKGDLDFSDDDKFPITTASEDTYADDLDDAIETMNAATVDLLASANATKDGTKISAVITGDGISLKKDAETAVYVLIPAGVYDINSTSNSKAIKNFTIYTNKGKFDIKAEDARKGENAGTAALGVAFNRNSLLNLYPVLEDSATPVDKYDITGLDDWNNAVAYALAKQNDHIEFNLLADITISEFPACPLYVTSDANKLILAADKTFTLHKDSYFATIENKGTLNLVDNSHIEELINKGVVNVAASEKVAGIATQDYTAWVTSAKNGIYTLENQGTIVLNGQMTAIATWSNTATDAIAETTLGTIQVNEGGNLIIGADTDNDGTIVNNGKVTLGAILTNNGTIEVATATGTIVSDDTPKTITNTGKITLDAPKDIFVKADGKENATSYITASSDGTVEVAITPAGVSTLPEMQEVNCVKMSGAWNADLVGKMNAKWASIEKQIWDGVTLDVAEIGEKLAAVKAITIDGTSAINNSGDAVDLGLPATAAASEIIVNGDLTIAKKVTIGKGALTHSPVITVLGSVTNNGEVYAGLTVGAAAVPGVSPANTSAIFTNAKDAKVSVVSTYASAGTYTYGDLSLYGTFVNNAVQANVEVKSVIFQVQGKSTFTGNYTTRS
ncbi:hypothetical protein [Bacteroides sp.]|uniref:hypothetical protein n=1 Tax=Bacteroides sp. TaxID=29523 RepID=UPI003AB85D3A